MKSILLKSFLPPVVAACLVLGLSSRAFSYAVIVMPDSAGPCLTDSGTNFIINYQEFTQMNTSITLTNSAQSQIVLSGPFNLLSGDTGVFLIEAPPLPVVLNPGGVFELPIHIQFQCQPSKNTYSATFGIFSNGALCAIDTITVNVLFLIADTIRLNLPAGNSNVISLAPDFAPSRHVIKVTDSGSSDIFLDSLQIADPNNISYFGAEGKRTFIFNDSLVSGQSNETAIMTLYPGSPGTYDIHLLLYYNGMAQPQDYLLHESISSNSLNGYPLTVEIPTFSNLIAGEQFCQKCYFRNFTPYDVLLSQVILNDDPRPGVQWSLEDTSILPAMLPPGEILTLEICALIPKGDTMPLSGSANIIYTNSCEKIDTATLPLSGILYRSSQASVGESTLQSGGFSIIPNPSSGEVTVSIPSGQNSTVEIYDVLGNLVLRKQAVAQFVWHGEFRSGIVAAGVYIVRVTEQGPDGSLSVSSKRLVFQR